MGVYDVSAVADYVSGASGPVAGDDYESMCESVSVATDWEAVSAGEYGSVDDSAWDSEESSTESINEYCWLSVEADNSSEDSSGCTDTVVGMGSSDSSDIGEDGSVMMSGRKYIGASEYSSADGGVGNYTAIRVKHVTIMCGAVVCYAGK